MPHIIIDYSQGLEQRHDIKALCDAIFEALAAEPAIPSPSAIKVRASSTGFWRIGNEPETFAHALFYMMEGRDDETKRHLSQVVLNVMDKLMPEVASLSVDPRDIKATTYAKRIKEDT